MNFSNFSIRCSSSKTNNPFDNLSLLKQNGFTIPTLTSVSQYVALLERFGIEGPHHLNRINLENTGYFTRIGGGAQFSVFKDIHGVRDGVVMKRAELSSVYDNDSTGAKELQQRRLKTLELEIRSLCHDRTRQHPNIVKLVAWGYDYSNRNDLYPLPVLYVEEAVCSLQTLLRDPRKFSPGRLSMATKYQLCLDVASGLECLRHCSIVHGDLKPDNVLIFKQLDKGMPFVAKLADFGLCIAIEKEEDITFSRYRSTPGWKPPEVESVGADQTISPELLFKCDSYSYGLLGLSTLALENGRSPLGDADQKDAESVLEDVCSVIDKASNLTGTEKEQATKYSRLICRHFLSASPHGRSFVSPELLKDPKSQAYSSCLRKITNTAEQLKVSAEAKSTYRQQGYSYWSFVDRSMLQQLDVDHRQSLLGDASWRLSGDILVGMSIGYCIQQPTGFREFALDYCIAAIKTDPPNPIAQGLVTKLADAISPSRGARNWTSDYGVEVAVEDMLFSASASGSWIAAAELAKSSPSRVTDARRIHRTNGGYNSEGFISVVGRKEPEPYLVEGSCLNISLPSLKEMEPTGFLRFSTSQLCRDLVDTGENTLLHLAAMLGREDLIIHIAQINSASINKQNKAGETPLYKACLAGQSQAIKALLSFGADASITETQFNVSCLHWLFMVDKEHMDEIATLLLRNGVSVDSRTTGIVCKQRLLIEADHFPFHWPHGTPFHWACHVGSFEAAQTLLNHGALVDEDDIPNDTRAHTALGSAMIRVDSAMVSFLLEHGADPTKQDRGGFTPLHLRASNVDSRNILMSRPLRLWGYLGSWENSLTETRRCVELFKSYGGRLDPRRNLPTDNTALLDAVISGDSDAVLALLEHGADANIAETYSGRLPLHLWAQVDREQIAYPESYFLVLKALVRGTKDCSATDTIYGNSVLHAALENPGGAAASTAIIKCLLQEAPGTLDLNARNTDGDTPLLLAIQNRSMKGQNALALYANLLQLGADPTVRDNDGRDFAWCLTKNFTIPDEKCLATLKQHMAGLSDVEKQRALSNSRSAKTGRTVLMNMVENAFVRCVQHALDLGVDLTAEDRHEMTALDVALAQGNGARTGLLEKWAMNIRHEPQGGEAIPEFLFDDSVIQADLENGSILNHSETPLRECWVESALYANFWTEGERYFAAPRIIQALIAAGAKTGSMKSTTGARYRDRLFVEIFEAKWFKREKQPSYDLWKVLYDYDDESDDTL